MRVTVATLSILVVPSLVGAQAIEPPSGLAAVELERSRACVRTLAEVTEMNRTLEPLVVRGRRLAALAEAIAIEDRTSVEPFDANDPVEARVRDWFQTDGALAQRYVAQPDPTLLTERSAGRETIKAAVSNAITEVQSEANTVLESNRELIERAGPCDGAIFVRPAVLEACATSSGAICEQAALPASEVTDFRFVDDVASVWQIQEYRPWTRPGPLQMGPQGQLDGARSLAYARVGNIVFSVAFSPIFREKQEMSADELSRYQALLDSIGLSFEHERVAFAPGIGLRAAIPQPLGDETRYVIHFGEASSPDVVWSAEAGTGRPLEATGLLGVDHVRRLRAGDALSLTAMGGAEGTEPEYSFELSNLGQAEGIMVLLNYMAGPMLNDFNRLVAGQDGPRP